MTNTTRARYTLEFKQEAVRLVQGGQSIAAAARTRGWSSRRCTTGSRPKRQGKLSGADKRASWHACDLVHHGVTFVPSGQIEDEEAAQ